MEISVTIRQLMERGPLPASVVSHTDSSEIVTDPSDSTKVMLRSERDLKAKVRIATEQRRAVPWSEITVPERLLFRQQHKRIGMKRLRCGSVYARGRYGVRCRRELLGAISAAKGGLDCFEVFDEYPSAHDDVIALIADGKVATVATTLWAPHRP